MELIHSHISVTEINYLACRTNNLISLLTNISKILKLQLDLTTPNFRAGFSTSLGSTLLPDIAQFCFMHSATSLMVARPDTFTCLMQIYKHAANRNPKSSDSKFEQKSRSGFVQPQQVISKDYSTSTTKI